MHKSLILILLFLSPLINIILISTAVESSWGEAFAQVIIKDEIILDEAIFEIQEPESAGLIMPFYGKVQERVYAGSIACSYARRELIVNGINYPFGPCWDWECGVGQCFCQTGYNFKEVPNVPLGTAIDTRFQKCRQWGGPGSPYSWGDMQHYFQLFSVTETKHTYNVYARYTENDPWSQAAIMYLMKTTPPGCQNAQNQYCSEHGLKVPSVKSKPVDWTKGDLELCEDYSGNNVRWAYTSLANEWLEDFQVFACFDKDRQKWQFLTDNNNTLDINTAIKICENNLRILLEFNIADSLDGVDPRYPCVKIIEDLKRFKNYGEYDDQNPFLRAYVFRKLIYQHELLHVKDFQKNLDNKREKIYDNKYKELVDGFQCEDFDDPEEAAEEIKEIIEDEWIENLMLDAWNDDPIVAIQLSDVSDDDKNSAIKIFESWKHIEMYDIIEAWIKEAEKCLN